MTLIPKDFSQEEIRNEIKTVGKISRIHVRSFKERIIPVKPQRNGPVVYLFKNGQPVPHKMDQRICGLCLSTLVGLPGRCDECCGEYDDKVVH